MRSISIHTVESVTKDKPITNQTSNFDYQNSHVAAGSVFAQFANGAEAPNMKTSDDKIVIGYLSNGLPYQIIVDGFYGMDGADRNWMFKSKLFHIRSCFLVSNHKKPIAYVLFSSWTIA